MKYSIDTSRLYMKEGPISYVTRVRIKMKEEVDAAVLRKAINEAIKRYPYFAVRVTLDEDGAFVLEGKHLTKIFNSTNFTDSGSIRYLYNYILKQGGITLLKELGLKEGDTVRIEDFEFEYTED